MLRVQRLQCDDMKFNKGCEWRGMPGNYSDETFPLLKNRLQRESLKTGISYRIVHNKHGLLLTIKLGHDNELFVSCPENITERTLQALSRQA